MSINVDEDAWERFESFRKAIRKPIKDVSRDAMRAKLARFGNDQAAVVDQSIENQWQGLFDLKKAKPAPGEKPVKSEKQVAAENARFEADQARNERSWNSVLDEPMTKLKLADALLARYQLDQDTPEYHDKIDWLRGRFAELLREVDASEVLGDPHLRATVVQLWGDRGLVRLKTRAAA